MQKKRPTLRTISEITGLGVTTVSRALKDGDELSVETKARVKKVAEDIGYTPNKAGVMLKTGRTYVIGLIINQSDNINEFARRMMMGISSTLRGTPYQLVVIPQFLDSDPMEPIQYILDNRHVDGIIFTHTLAKDERVSTLIEKGIPFVTHGRTEFKETHPYYDFDNYDFIYQATKRLLAKGRQKVLLVQPPNNFNYKKHQVNGLIDAIDGSEAIYQVPEAISLNSTPVELYDYFKQSALDKKLPDGILCGNEGLSLAIISFLQEMGVKIGADIDVITKETSDILDYLTPKIDSYVEDFSAAGSILATLLLQRLDNKKIDSLQIIEKPKACFRT